MSRFAQILWLVLSLTSGSAIAQTGIRWAPNLAAARRVAAQSQVPMLIHFYGDNCLPCKTLEERVLNQDSVIKTLNKYFVCVRVNATQDPTTASTYQVHSWPTDVFVSPDGQVLHQGVCKQDITGYMDVLHSVAVTNRDRNTMLATERAKQNGAPNQNQVATDMTATQSTGTASSLPPVAAQPTNNAFAAPPAIAASTAASQFQIAPPARTPMMDSNAGLPPLSTHLASKPLGTDGLGSNSNVAGQMNAQANLPSVANNDSTARKTTTAKSPASLVSNPYYPESEPMVCTPDGKCGPASSIAQTSAQGTPHQLAATQQTINQNKSIHLASTSTLDNGPQFPPLTTASGGAPTFQPKSANTASTSAITLPEGSTPVSEPKIGLIENEPKREMEPAAFNGYCPIALVKTGLKVQGKAEHAVRHRGRTYLMESPEALKEFMQAPDRYSPVLSGYDPMIFLESGMLVDGSLEHALYDPNSGTIVLFANNESQTRFKADPVRNTKALSYILNAANKK